MAPSFFMDALERGILDGSELKPSVWCPYIDDVFLIWENREESLKQSLDYLNSCHPSIKFTANYSSEAVEFLDVKVICSEDRLITDHLIVPADTHQYLHASSSHGYHVKRSIPYSQALKLDRICSEPRFFDHRSD